jgi:hypothetical protein
LDRALPLAEVDHVAVAVGEHLDLDVPGPVDIAFQEDPPVTEARACLTGGPLERLPARLGGDAHALATAAGGGLEQHRIADPFGLGQGRGHVGQGVLRAGQCGHPGHGRQPLGLDLVAHGSDRLRRRADERHPGGRDGLGERGALG